MSRRLHQDLPPTATVSSHSSQPSSSTISSALDGLSRGSALHMTGASHDREANTISPTSGNKLRLLSDARWSPDCSITSSDQLLALREFLAQRAQDVPTEARSRSRVSSSDPDRCRPDSGGDLFDDVASDCSDYGESILSGRRFSLEEPVDGAFTSEDLWSKLSITRAMKTWDSPDNYSLLANGDTFLDMHARSSSPTSQLQSESLQPRIDPHPRRTGSRSPAPTARVSINPEEFLPNFLDLRLGVDTTGSVTGDVSPGPNDLHFLQDDERSELVPEGSSANARGLESERPDITLAQQSSATSHGPRRVQSATELVSSRSPPKRPRLPSQDDDHDRGHDKGTGTPTKYSELTHSRNKTEPGNIRRENSYRVKRVQDHRTRDGQHPNPGLSVAVDPRSESRPRSRSREIFSVSQRHRAMTLQEVTVTGTPTADRLHRSASTLSSTPSASSFRSGGRYRTLEDRAYRHPDVPHSPLFSDLDHGASAQDTCHIGPSLREPSNNVRSNHQVSSPERGHIPHMHSRNPSSEVYSRTTSPRPPVPPPHMPPNHNRNDSYAARRRIAQSHVHRPGSSLDSRSRPGSPATALPHPSTIGIGLSLIDNGAFEAPRRAPEPRTVTHERANSASRTAVQAVQRVAPAPTPATAEEPTTDDAHAHAHARKRGDSDSAIALSLTGLSGFPRRVWSKRQKQPPPRSSDGLRSRMGSASSSELDLKTPSTSFINMVENEHDHPVNDKPQRKGLSLFKRR